MTMLPTIAPLSAHLIAAEMASLCDSVAAELDDFDTPFPADFPWHRGLDAADLAAAASSARRVLAATVVLDETLDAAFDASLVRWAPDGALVWV